MLVPLFPENRPESESGASVQDDANGSTLDVSIVIPVKDEEKNILPLARRITAAFESLQINYEVIWVDDGSKDRTLYRIKQVMDVESRHRVIVLGTNFGQSAALRVGFRASRGRLVATLDGDLQNDPYDLPQMITELQVRHVDMVTGIRAKRNDNVIRIVSSRIANRIRNAVTGDNIKDVGCSIRVMKRDSLLNLPAFRGMHRFLPTLVKLGGGRVRQVPVSHHSRRHGVTKYGVGNRLWVGIGDLFWIWWYQKRYVQATAKEFIATHDEVGVANG